MSDLGGILASLGLEQYHDVFISEGFDSWETVLDITENDLDALNVKLGHRRKLQRYIASQRGIALDQPLSSPWPEGAGERGPEGSVSTGGESQAERGGASIAAAETKRKYRRHPKPDDNAPERPPSAYVLFSNAIREEIKGQDLSFTDIAKLVGQRWQSLSAAEREPYETRASNLKDAFNQQLAEYKKTEQYKEYCQYLSDFKAKHGGGGTDGKRPKLEESESAGSPVAPTASSTRSPELSESAPHLADPTNTRPVLSEVPPANQMRLNLGSPASSGPGISSQSSLPEARTYHSTGPSEPLPYHSNLNREPNRVHSITTPLSTPGESGGYFDSLRSNKPTSHTSTSAGAGSAEGVTLPRLPGKPQLAHQDTTLSNVSSVPSNLSYGSGSTGHPPTPLTPRDEPWAGRPTGHEPINNQSNSWEAPRPILPPFQSPHGSTYPMLQPLKMPDRYFAHPPENSLRLPPPNASSSATTHDTHSHPSRAQPWSPLQYSDQRKLAEQRGEPSPNVSRAERGVEETGSPLDLLARAVDAQHRENR